MNEQIQAIVTVLSLVNPAICAAMFASAAIGRSLGEKMTDATNAAVAILKVQLGPDPGAEAVDSLSRLGAF